MTPRREILNDLESIDHEVRNRTPETAIAYATYLGLVQVADAIRSLKQ